MVDHIVGDVAEAVKLCSDWKAKGTHSWFRGQVKPWPLTSTLARAVKDGKSEVALKRIGLFQSWLKQQSSLRHMLDKEHEDEQLAVLQHYGFSTHFIDFTTEPAIAGFFAMNGPDTTPREQGLIICIDPDKVVEYLCSLAERSKFPRNLWSEKVEVSVSDLWRLQAQAGRFLYIPTFNIIEDSGINSLYGLGYDRILFTHDGSRYPLMEERIYPKRKSRLEIELDEFFTYENIQDNQAMMNEIADKLNFDKVEFEPHLEEYILKSGTNPHDSWCHRMPNEWIELPDETFHDVSDECPIASIPFSTRASAKDIETKARDYIKSFLQDNPAYRSKLTKWTLDRIGSRSSQLWHDLCHGSKLLKLVQVDDRNGLFASQRNFTCDCLERVWDGMRRLPFTDDQIATALAATLTMCVRPSVLSSSNDVYVVPVQQITSRAGVKSTSLSAAFRPDLADVLHPDFANVLHESTMEENVMVFCSQLRAEYLFDFYKLVDLFATELIPTQVLVRMNSLARDGAIFYSPATVTMIDYGHLGDIQNLIDNLRKVRR